MLLSEIGYVVKNPEVLKETKKDDKEAQSEISEDQEVNSEEEIETEN